MTFKMEDRELYNTFILAEKKLFNSPRIKFERNILWRKKHLTHSPGIYALFENESLIYVGETGDLLKRMCDITRTVNHSFRKQLGFKKFNGIKSSKKFIPEIESSLDKYFDDELYISFLEVNFGRLEIETYLVDKYQTQIINSEKKRKLSINYELLKELENACT